MFFLHGATVTIDNEIQGNVYILATNSATISAPIYGNVYIVSNNVTFKNSDPSKPVYVSGSAYIYGSDVNLSIYCQDLYVVSSSLTISYDSAILRDIRVSSPTLNLYGIVKRNAFVTSSNISLQNDKNQNGLIEGNLNYYNSEELSISRDLVVGDLVFNLKASNQTPAWLSNLYTSIIRFICSVLFLLLFTRIAPTVVHPEKGFILKKFLGTFLYGIVMLITIPLLCLFLIYLSSRMIIFAFPVILVYAAFLVISFFVTMIYIIGLLEKAFKFKSLSISIGILFGMNVILYVISLLSSILTIILTLLLVISGFGLLSSLLFEKRTKTVTSKSKNK